MSALELKYPRIREMREDQHLTQADMARILRVSQVAYSYYEIGKRDIPTDTLIEIADYFNCSIDYMLGRTNHK